MNKLPVSLYKDAFFCFFVLLLSLFVIIPFFQKGYFPTHDGEWAVVRLSDMYREVKDMQIPPRISGNLNFGYGYPLFNFAYPFPYYTGLILIALGVGLVNSIKILFGLSVIASSIIMYFLASRLWVDRYSGVVSSLLYLYLPYRLVDLYVRGSIGESISFIFFPLIIFCIYQIFHLSHKHLFTVILALSVAALVMTHNIMTVLFLPIIFISVLIIALLKRKTEFFLSIFGVLLGVMLSAFFWIPALVEKNYIYLSKVPIADRNLYFVKLSQLIFPTWGYGTPTDANPFTYQIGIPHIFSFLIIFSLAIYYRIKKRDLLASLAIIICSVIVIYILMLFNFTGIIWKSIPLLNEINYPWTLLAPIGFLISLIAGYGVKFKKLRLVMTGFVLIAVVFILPYAKPQYMVNKGDQYYLTNDGTTTSSDELMPLWVKEKPVSRFSNKIEVLSNVGVVNDVFYNSKKISFKINSPIKEIVRINSIYYPGWKAYINDNASKISYQNNKGVMDLVVPAGANYIQLYFSETPLRLGANIISIASFMSLIIFIIFSKSDTFRINLKKTDKV